MLHNAFHILHDLDSLSEVNAQVIVFDIVSLLPNFVENRWSKNEFKSKCSSGSYFKF